MVLTGLTNALTIQLYLLEEKKFMAYVLGASVLAIKQKTVPKPISVSTARKIQIIIVACAQSYLLQNRIHK